MPPTWNSAKAKVQLRLSIQRLRGLQQKMEAQAKIARREISVLLEKGKTETSKIKVEMIINEDIHGELLELLELYCELLLARFGLLDQNTRDPDPGVGEAVRGIVFAASRTELKELHVLRDLLMHKYGREFSINVMENRDSCVSDRIIRKVSVAMPSSELVDAYLREIAKVYGVPWTSGKSVSNVNVNIKGTAQTILSEAVLPVQEQSTTGPDTTLPSALTEDVPPVHEPETASDTELPSAQDAEKGTNIWIPSFIKVSNVEVDVEEDEFALLSKRFADLKRR